MYILFDIGGTNMRIACSKDGVEVDEPTTISTLPDNFEKSIEEFYSAVQRLTGGQAIKAIAGGVPGSLDKEKTMLLTAPNLPDWNRQPLKEELQQKLGASVYLENDTAMTGLGEATAGAGKGKGIVVYITVSTGVGGCRITNGEITSNARGFEPGHQIIDPEGPQCGCGGKGHLEAFIGGAALERTHGAKPETITDPAVWEQAAYYLALGLNNVLVFWSPHIIVLGGSVMKSINIDRVRHHLRNIVKIYTDLPPVELSLLGEKAGLIGALTYLKRQEI